LGLLKKNPLMNKLFTAFLCSFFFFLVGAVLVKITLLRLTTEETIEENTVIYGGECRFEIKQILTSVLTSLFVKMDLQYDDTQATKSYGQAGAADSTD
jgi:hypothetical protein